MAKLDEGIGKICNDALRPSIGDGRNPLKQWGHLGNTHHGLDLCKHRSHQTRAPAQRRGSPNNARALRWAILRRSASLIGARSIHAVAGSIGS